MENVTSPSSLLKCRRGTVAIEFALVAPVFLLLLFGVIVFSAVTTTYSAVQQLAAESARSTVAGLTDSERDSLARAFVAANITAYPFLNPSNLSVSTAALTGSPAGFRVTINYDMSGSFIYAFAGLIPLPRSGIARSAVVLLGS